MHHSAPSLSGTKKTEFDQDYSKRTLSSLTYFILLDPQKIPLQLMYYLNFTDNGRDTWRLMGTSKVTQPLSS